MSEGSGRQRQAGQSRGPTGSRAAEPTGLDGSSLRTACVNLGQAALRSEGLGDRLCSRGETWTPTSDLDPGARARPSSASRPLPASPVPVQPEWLARPEESRPRLLRRPDPAPGRAGPAPERAPAPPPGARQGLGRAALSSRARPQASPAPPRPPPLSDTSARSWGGGGRAESQDRRLRGSAFLSASRTAFSPTWQPRSGRLQSARERGGQRSPVLATDRPFPPTLPAPRTYTVPRSDSRQGVSRTPGSAGHTARRLGGSSGLGPGARGAGTSWA